LTEWNLETSYQREQNFGIILYQRGIAHLVFGAGMCQVGLVFEIGAGVSNGLPTCEIDHVQLLILGWKRLMSLLRCPKELLRGSLRKLYL
jgi:hypothetical protein